MEVFFDNIENQRILMKRQKAIARLPAENNFEKKRNEYITRIIDFIISDPKGWDDATQVNISFFGEIFISELDDDDMNKRTLDVIFASLLRFVMEKYITTPGEMSMESRAIRSFAEGAKDNFEEEARDQIDYAFNKMTLSIFKRLYNEDGIKAIRDFSKVKTEAENLKEKWDEELKEKEKKVSSLNEILIGQQDAYNFVGLYAGFAKLGRVKSKELIWSRCVMFAIGAFIPLFIILQAVFFHTSSVNFEKAIDLVKLIPSASITLIMVYYFRVSLSNYSSVRAQIMQIELRKSLCRFIQRYSEYSEGISKTNPNLLSKFEDVIFSNIMASEDKIPSTFDGIEQMANLISSLKPK